MEYIRGSLVGMSVLAIVAVGVLMQKEARQDVPTVALNMGAMDAHGVHAANSCGGSMDVDYIESLTNTGSSEVRFAGCGGLL